VTARHAGHRLGHWIQLAVGGVAWTALMPVCIIFDGLDTSPLAERKLTIMLFVLAWKAGLFAVSAGCGLAEWLRSGSQVAGPAFATAEFPMVPTNTAEAAGENSAGS
jgi:choline-glycine betaine transporter